MLPLTALLPAMLQSPGAFRPRVRLCFNHFCPSGVGLCQQGHRKLSGALRSQVLYPLSYRCNTDILHSSKYNVKLFPVLLSLLGEGIVDRNRHMVYERRVISINIARLSFIHGKGLGRWGGVWAGWWCSLHIPIRRRKLVGEHPGDIFPHINMVDAVEMVDTMELVSQEKDEGPEPVLQEAVVIYGQARDAIHPHTTTSLNNQAIHSFNQGKYEQARELFQRTLTLCEQVLGSEHADTATCLNNLAGAYYAQDKYEQAEEFFQRALEVCRQELGPKHPDTVFSFNNLVRLYRKQGHY